MQTNESNRLLTLDALRGVAALMVVGFHGFDDADLNAVPSGFLAVDLFFILSGLVLARAYANRLGENLSFFAFFKLRIIRLYPLFILGLSIDAVRAIVNVFRGRSQGFGFSGIASAYGREILLIPSSPEWEKLFKLNSPAWSLSFELLVNVFFALILFRLRTRMLAIVALTAFAFLVLSASVQNSFNVGSDWSTLVPGLMRCLFGFCMGMLIAKLPQPSINSSWWMVTMVAMFVWLLFIKMHFAVEGFCIAVALPLIILIGSRCNPPAAIFGTCVLLGEISYPIYALHWPLLYFFRTIGRALHLPPLINVALITVIIAFIAYFVSRFFDLPLRSYLMRKTQSQTPSLV